MTGQKDNRTERQQDRKTSGPGQIYNRIMWASRAHGMTYDRTERQQIRRTTDQKDNRKQNRVETGQLDYKTVSQQDRLAKRHLYQ